MAFAVMERKFDKYIVVERYLNNVKFGEIAIGSLLARVLEANYYGRPQTPVIKSGLRLIKYLASLPFSSPVLPRPGKYIFTKISDKFHLNKLIDPLILNYLGQSIILCREKSFDQRFKSDNLIGNHCLDSARTILNNKTDAGRILQTTFNAFCLLLKNKRRLKLSIRELMNLTSSLLIQLRRVSYWDYYFTKSVTKPKCVITEFDRDSLCSPLILSAKKNNILTITLTHGVILDYGFFPVLAERIFCWGELQKNQYMKRGISSNRINITGNPMFDNFEQRIAFNSPESNILTFGLSVSPEPQVVNKPMIESFINAINYLGNAHGIIKLHPSLNKEDFNWVQLKSDKVVFYDSLDIANDQLFKKISALVVHISGIANEAIAAGVPVIVMETNTPSDMDIFQRNLIHYAGCPLAENEYQLIELFKKITDHTRAYNEEFRVKRDNYIKLLYGSTGDDSVKEMIAAINKLVNANDRTNDSKRENCNSNGKVTYNIIDIYEKTL